MKADSGFPFRVSSAGEDGAEMHTLDSRAALPTSEAELAPTGLIEACSIPFGACPDGKHQVREIELSRA